MSKPTKDYVLEQYRLLSANSADLINKFSGYYREQVITLDDLYAVGKPNQKQAVAMFGGYAATKFAMTSESIADYVSVFSGAPEAVLTAMSNSADKAALLVALDSIEETLSKTEAEQHALDVADGKAHAKNIKSIKTAHALLVADGPMNHSNFAAYLDLYEAMGKVVREHQPTQELATAK